MSSKKEREEFRKWTQEMGLGSMSDEACMSTLRGPLRDFLLNFGMKRARSNGYISTVQANLLVSSKTKGSHLTDAELRTEKELESEMARSILSEKEKKKQEIDANNSQKLQRIEETLHSRSGVTVSEVRWENFEQIVKLLNNLDERLNLSHLLLNELRRTRGTGTDAEDLSRTLAVPIEVPQDCEELLNKLSAVAHHAFEDKIMKHFKTPESQVGQGSAITAEEFNAIINEILKYSESSKIVFKWVESERQRQLELLAEMKNSADQLEGMNIKQKVDQLIDKWSGLHIEMHQKNEARKVELAETAAKLDAAIDRMKSSQAGQIIGEENVKMLVAKLKVEELILACREFEKDTNPRNAFARVSIVGSKDIDESFLDSLKDLEMQNYAMRESVDDRVQWVEALDDGEVAELTQVLKKTWPQQVAAFEELRCSKDRNNQLPTAMLKAKECVKLTNPKPLEELLMSMSDSNEGSMKKTGVSRMHDFVGANDSRASSADMTKESGSSSSGFETTMSAKTHQGFDELYKNFQKLEEVCNMSNQAK